MTYRPPYHKAATPTAISTGEGRAIDALYNMLYSFGAIVYMMRALLNEGEDQQHIAEHVWHLLDQQHSMLAGVYEELGREQKEREGQASLNALSEAAQKLRLDLIEAGAKTGADTASIAAAMNIPNEDIEHVISQLRSAQVQRATRAARA